MRSWSGTSARGGGRDRELFEWFTTRMKESIEYAIPALRSYWLQVAASKFRNPAWLHRFEQNTELVLIEDGNKTKLEFQFNDKLAAAFEYGWAPPKSSDFMDGIGQWDGGPHDMRDYLLADGKQYRRVKLTNELGMMMHEFNSATPLDYTMAKMTQAVGYKEKGNKYWALGRHNGNWETERWVEERKRRVQQILAKAAPHRGRFPKHLDASLSVAPARHDNGVMMYDEHVGATHRYSMLRKARRAKSSIGGGAMEVVRTISRSVNHGNDWFSRGIEPGNTLEDTLSYAQQIIVEAMARGKG